MRKLKKYQVSDVYTSTYILKKYTDNYYRLSYFKSLRKKGFISCQNKKLKDFRLKLKLMSFGMLYLTYGNCHFKSKNLFKKFISLSDKYFNRFYSNLSRARNKIFEYSYCNEFEYFVTLTIDSNKYNRTDLKTYYTHFSQFLRDYRKKYNIDIKYLFIPEQHKSGAWHLHGLIKGIPDNHFIINENGYLDWLPYKNKFGYISLSPIKNSEACSVYMTKYITKDLFKKTKINKNSKLYYCSRNLKTSIEIYRGDISDINILEQFKLNYENDYIKIYDIRLLD